MPARVHHRPSVRLAVGVAAAALLASSLLAGASAASASTDPTPSVSPTAAPAPDADPAPDGTPAPDATPAPEVTPAPAPADDAPEAATPLATTVTIDTPSEIVYGQATILNISVAGPDGEPVDGTVYIDLGTTFGDGFALVDGFVSVPIGSTDGTTVFPYSFDDPVLYKVDYVPADPSAYAPSRAELLVTLTPAPTALNLLVSDTAEQGAVLYLATYFDFDPTPAFPDGFTYQGTISYYRDGVWIGDSTPSASPGMGYSDFQYVPTELGPATFTAVYSGSSKLQPSSSAPQTVTVVPPVKPEGDGRSELASTGSNAAELGGVGILTALVGAAAVVLAVLRRRRDDAPHDEH